MSYSLPLVRYQYKIIEGNSNVNPTVAAHNAEIKVNRLVKKGWEPISIGGGGAAAAIEGAVQIHSVYIILRKPRQLFRVPT